MEEIFVRDSVVDGSTAEQEDECEGQFGSQT